MIFYVSKEQGRACTMNCGLPMGDPRTKEDMVRECGDCVSIAADVARQRERERVTGVAKALLGIAEEDGQVIVSAANMRAICDALG